jgi:hypothetical protein
MKRFTQLDDGNYLDNKTGLVWKEHPEKGSFTWHEAKELENNDWRLPTFDELRGIVSKKHHNNTRTKLPNMFPRWFWSASPYANDSAWIVGFLNGYDDTRLKSYDYTVRLVKRSS